MKQKMKYLPFIAVLIGAVILSGCITTTPSVWTVNRGLLDLRDLDGTHEIELGDNFMQNMHMEISAVLMGKYNIDYVCFVISFQLLEPLNEEFLIRGFEFGLVLDTEADDWPNYAIFYEGEETELGSWHYWVPDFTQPFCSYWVEGSLEEIPDRFIVEYVEVVDPVEYMWRIYVPRTDIGGGIPLSQFRFGVVLLIGCVFMDATVNLWISWPEECIQYFMGVPYWCESSGWHEDFLGQ